MCGWKKTGWSAKEGRTDTLIHINPASLRRCHESAVLTAQRWTIGSETSLQSTKPSCPRRNIVTPLRKTVDNWVKSFGVTIIQSKNTMCQGPKIKNELDLRFPTKEKTTQSSPLARMAFFHDSRRLCQTPSIFWRLSIIALRGYPVMIMMKMEGKVWKIVRRLHGTNGKTSKNGHQNHEVGQLKGRSTERSDDLWSLASNASSLKSETGPKSRTHVWKQTEKAYKVSRAKSLGTLIFDVHRGLFWWYQRSNINISKMLKCCQG